MTKLQSFRYEGDRKNFNFDKYMNLHIEQHNQHSGLQEYGVAPLAKNLKTLWFQDRIRDPSLNAVKASINANRANFTDFDSVNSLTPKSIPVRTKLVLFGRYVLNIYVGIVKYFLRKTKTRRAKIYLPTQRTNRGISYDIN
jgi:hypothetical protein